MDYDPEKELWIPGRRKFLFLGLSAALFPFLQEETFSEPWWVATLGSDGVYTVHESAKYGNIGRFTIGYGQLIITDISSDRKTATIQFHPV